jgi:hypothetical protein
VEFDTYFAKSAQFFPILVFHHFLKEEICAILKKMRKTWQSLYAVCIQPLIKAIILDKTPHILEGTHYTAFKVSYEWTKYFTKVELNWSYKAAITAGGKLPKNFKKQGKTMAQRCDYLVKIHNKPKELVVNTEQTCIHLVPI